MMADSGVATGYDYRLPVMAGLLLLLGCAVDNTNSYQRPRDGYNTFSDTSTVLPGGAPSTLNGIMHPKWSEPYFDISVPRNVTALVGKSAYLSCRVRNLGNKTVSWIRHRDLHILTVATYTYTTDQRFQTSYHRDVSEWTLQIKWAQERDAGTYECQVSTQPVKSYSVQLKVVGPHEINDTNATMRQRYGGGHHHDEQQPPPPYQRDSPLNRAYNDDGGGGGGDGDGTDDMHDNAGGGGDQQLQPNDNAAGVDWESDDYDDSRAASIADGLPDSRTSAFWRWWQANEPPDTGRPQARVPTAAILGGPDLYVDKGSTINLTCAIHFSPEPPAYIFWYHLNKVISYDSARIRMETIKGEPSVSYLLIHDADLADSGKYSCSPSGTGVSHIRVHVLNGERPEAMQTSGAAAPTPSIRSVIGGGGGGGLMVLAFLISIIMVQQHLTVPHEAAADIAQQQQQQQQYHRQRLTYQLDSKTGRPQQQCGGDYSACASCIVNDWRIGAAGYR